ncbi:thiamine-phosphate kinase [Methylobacterium oryzae]|uniref:thiamine-phosphate kinase n=1 Tax=Methylobacterium oryzae TaxID=334852 RepID=UPI002F339D44
MAGPARASEEGLIARYFAPLAGPGADGLRDDAATLTPAPGHDLVLTADAVVAGVHYFAEDPPASIARKALGVNLSDIAAKGAVPRGFLLTLALPDDWTEAWLAGFAQGLPSGDRGAVEHGALVEDLLVDERHVERDVLPLAARVGDRICVTGTIGDAALGLRMRLEGDAPWAAGLDPALRAELADRYLHPRPRLAAAPAIRRHASAAMDVSDGLAGDLAKMLSAGRTARVATADVPLSEAARCACAADPALIEAVLTGGDDYEILCTVAPERLADFRAEAAAAGIAVAAIGTVTSGDGPPRFEMRDGAERVFAAGAFSHF